MQYYSKIGNKNVLKKINTKDFFFYLNFYEVLSRTKTWILKTPIHEKNNLNCL